MKEILTDELIEVLSNRYEMYKELCNGMNVADPFTFEEYVEMTLKFRAWRLRKGGIHVEV